MPIEILMETVRFRTPTDRETKSAWLRCGTPWVAPEAYLHVVFKPPSKSLLKRISKKLNIPAEVAENYQRQNGAMLFGGQIDIFGIVEEESLIDREDSGDWRPFDMLRSNITRRVDTERYLIIGGYGCDGSKVCVDRTSGKVGVSRRTDPKKVVFMWDSMENWLRAEIKRFDLLFDTGGKLTEGMEKLPPPSE